MAALLEDNGAVVLDRGMLRVAHQFRAENLQARVRLTVVCKQPCLGEGQVELILGVIGRIVIEERERLGARVPVEQERGGPRAGGQRDRGVIEASVGSDGTVRIAITRSDVGQIQLRAFVPLPARCQLTEALLGFLVVAGIVGEEREPAVNLRLWSTRGAQAFKLLASWTADPSALRHTSIPTDA